MGGGGWIKGRRCIISRKLARVFSLVTVGLRKSFLASCCRQRLDCLTAIRAYLQRQ